MAAHPDDVWIFGYGSLIWKVDFHQVERVVGHVKGYGRRFWQSSEDHRGVPGAPGRVCTLVPASTISQDLNAQEMWTWGVAYRVPASHVPQVMRHLDFREKGGYSLHPMPFYPRDTSRESFPVSVYLGTADSPNFMGVETLESVAAIIARSVGPSGPNPEYLYNLADAMRLIAPEAADEHLFGLEERVRALRRE